MFLKEEKQKWKIDFSRFLMQALKSIIFYMLVPTVVFQILPGQGIVVDAHTYFSVFATLLLISIIRLVLYPPKYMVVKE